MKNCFLPFIYVGQNDVGLRNQRGVFLKRLFWSFHVKNMIIGVLMMVEQGGIKRKK